MDKRMRRHYRAHAVIAVTAVVICAISLFAKPPAPDEWRVRENLVARLSAEWAKIGILERELSNVADALQELRNVELFPAEVTGLNEQSLIAFDKDIEKVEKRHRSVAGDVAALRPPLTDAVAILREMVAGRPVKEMFTALEKGNLDRITHMLDIKHRIDSLWTGVDSTLSTLRLRARLPVEERRGQAGFEREFFDIIKANLGMQSQTFYDKLNAVKDSLVARAKPTQIDEMFLIELQQVRSNLDNKRARLAAQKLMVLAKRYESRASLDQLNVLLARAQFKLGRYEDAVRTAQLLPDRDIYGETKVFCRTQSWYALKQYAAIWEWGSRFDFTKTSGKTRNLLLWITLESGLALGKTGDMAKLTTLADPQAPYMLHVLHALGRAFVVQKDWKTAESVFERALRYKAQDVAGLLAYDRILLSNAQAYYETGDYEKSLSIFFPLLNKENMFEEALFGIVWCYIRMGAYDKAELSLRKLINQSPSSARAAEGIYVMSQRFAERAQFEWRKAVFLDKEIRRQEALQQKLADRAVRDTASAHNEKFVRARAELSTMLQRLRNEKRPTRDEIAACYQRALDAANLIVKYYQTGSFQEVLFSAKREELLHKIDSVQLAIQEQNKTDIAGKQAIADVQQNAQKIKNLSKKSAVLLVDFALERYRWEREYVDWVKDSINTAQKNLETQAAAAVDSSSAKRLRAQKALFAPAMDVLVKQEDVLDRQRRQELTDACTAVLVNELDTADEFYVRYHLGELYYDRENADYLEAYTRFEADAAVHDSLRALYNEGKVLDAPAEPRQPRLDHGLSMAQFRLLIDRFPTGDLTPAVRYSLGWCFSDVGTFDSALAQMTIVATAFPRCNYAPQAWMYIGEHAFERGQLARAAESYQAVMKYPQSQWFDEALYKYAWTQYRLSNPEKAISSFLALVDLGEKSPTGKGLLEKESMDYIAISFSEADATGEKGLTRATKFIQRFGDADKGAQILGRLASVYRDQGRYDMAEKTYRTFLKTFPAYKNSPMIERELLAVLEKSMNAQQSNDAKIAYFRKYNHAGDWAAAQTDAAVRAQGDSLAAQVLYDAAISYHQLALQKSDTSAYAKAVTHYEEFIRNYPASPSANECHYNLAEILFSLGNYFRAAEEYMAVSRRYPGSKYRETAAWNAIVASQNLLKQEKGGGQ